MHTASSIIAAAKARGIEPTIVQTPGATIIVVAAAAPNADDLLPLPAAAEIAKCSTRTLREAGRAGELTLYGRQRSRTVRRSDLLAWVESRRVRPVEGPDDSDLERRIARLSRAGGSK